MAKTAVFTRSAGLRSPAPEALPRFNSKMPPPPAPLLDKAPEALPSPTSRRSHRLGWPTRILTMATLGAGLLTNTVLPQAKAPVVILGEVADISPTFCFDARKSITNHGAVLSFDSSFRICLTDMFEMVPVTTFNNVYDSAHLLTADFYDLDSGLPISSNVMASQLSASGSHEVNVAQFSLALEAAHKAGKVPLGAVTIAHSGNGNVDDAVTNVPLIFSVSSLGTASVPTP